MNRFFNIAFTILFVTISGCTDKSNKENIDLKRRELDLKEKELELREKELNLRNYVQPNVKESLSSIYEKVKKGVYLIYTKNKDGISQGSAFVINKGGLALSNFHVFEDASSAIAINEFGDKFMISEIIDYDKEKDFIIFRLGNQDNIPYLDISNETPGVGEPCFAIGNPKGLLQTLSTGIISGFRNKDLLQTTTAITNGSSGGPLFNEKGQVIGITTSGLGEANLNFALNIKSIPFRKYIYITAESNESSNLSDGELQEFVRNYYKLLVEEDWDHLLSIYSKKLNRFYDKFDITNYEAVSLAKKYKSKFSILRTEYNIRWNTFTSYNSRFGSEIKFTMDYKIIREEGDKPSLFILDIIMLVDKENHIKSIYENILSKK